MARRIKGDISGIDLDPPITDQQAGVRPTVIISCAVCSNISGADAAYLRGQSDQASIIKEFPGLREALWPMVW